MLTRKGFHKNAKPIAIDILGQTFECPPCQFGTGSLGWVGKGGIQIQYAAHPIACWANARITVIDSKLLPTDNTCAIPAAVTTASTGATSNNCRLNSLSRATFRQGAAPIPVNVGESLVVIAPREFAAGSLGWTCEDVLEVVIGDVVARCLVEIDLVINGSKRLPASSPAAPQSPLTRSQFLETADPVSCYVQGRTITLNRQEFSTGTLGWFAQHGFKVDLNGQKLSCTAQMMIWVNDSNRLP